MFPEVAVEFANLHSIARIVENRGKSPHFSDTEDLHMYDNIPPIQSQNVYS